VLYLRNSEQRSSADNFTFYQSSLYYRKYCARSAQNARHFSGLTIDVLGDIYKKQSGYSQEIACDVGVAGQ
jgi:hypothetical protein